jgi:hypothetical protein
MATKKKTPAKNSRPPKVSKAAKAPKRRGQSGGSRDVPPPTSPNLLLIGSDGLYVRSGSTGEVRKLTAEETAAVEPLLEQRQALGTRITDELTNRGFTLAPDPTIDL